MSIRSERKEEHLKLAQMFFLIKKNIIVLINCICCALLCLKQKSIQLFWDQKCLAKMFLRLFFINAMTGGSAASKQINQALGQVAQQQNIALALGSASILAKETDQLDSFMVARAEDPDGVLIVNVNPETPISAIKQIIQELNADALQIHLNTIQEIAMPEGDRDFRWLDSIKAIRTAIDLPIIIKEVGFGLDQTSIHLLKVNGIEYFDVAGSGGTNFAQIENARNASDVSYLEDLGLPTVVTALMAWQEQVKFFLFLVEYVIP